MVEISIQEGKVPFKIPSIDEPCFTYYKIVGELSCGKAPVVVAHGGPGAGHEYLLIFADLWRDYGLPVVFYDQIGCASSTHLPQTAGDESFWQENLFQDELDNLLDFLELRRGPGFHFLGQSWGGMLGSAFAARQPEGLRRLVLASALASKVLSAQGVRMLRDQMPADMREAMEKAEEKGDFESPEYKRALDYYYRTYVCRADPFPPKELLPALKNLSQDTTVYRTMNGPSPLTTLGSLKEWSVISRLPEIQVPTLVYNGEYDTSHDIAQVPFFELIPRVRWITFQGAGHMCHVEGPELRARILKIVGEFLTQTEIASPAALWDGNYTKYCTISFPFLYGLVISDFLLDIWILAIPIPGILRLQISARRKFSIVAVFLLAFVGLGASIARMVQYVQIEQGGTNYLLHTDHERLITASFFYTMMESGICLIAVNLPSLCIISFPSTPGEFIRSMRSLIELSFLRGSSTDVARHGSESIGSNVKEDAETMPVSERPSVTSQV